MRMMILLPHCLPCWLNGSFHDYLVCHVWWCLRITLDMPFSLMAVLASMIQGCMLANEVLLLLHMLSPCFPSLWLYGYIYELWHCSVLKWQVQRYKSLLHFGYWMFIWFTVSMCSRTRFSDNAYFFLFAVLHRYHKRWLFGCDQRSYNSLNTPYCIILLKIGAFNDCYFSNKHSCRV